MICRISNRDNGRVLDGTGNPSFVGDVGLVDGKYEQLKAALPDCRIVFDRDSSLPNRRKSRRVGERSRFRYVRATMPAGRGMTSHRLISAALKLPVRLEPARDEWITEAGGAVTRDGAGRFTGVDLRASWVKEPQ